MSKIDHHPWFSYDPVEGRGWILVHNRAESLAIADLCQTCRLSPLRGQGEAVVCGGMTSKHFAAVQAIDQSPRITNRAWWEILIEANCQPGIKP